MPVTFLTSVDSIAVPDEIVAELLRRLDRHSPARAAIESRDSRGVRLTEDGKHDLLRTLEAWGFESDGFETMGDLADVRIELMRDLRVPPFND